MAKTFVGKRAGRRLLFAFAGIGVVAASAATLAACDLFG